MGGVGLERARLSPVHGQRRVCAVVLAAALALLVSLSQVGLSSDAAAARRVLRDVPYCRNMGQRLLMDMYWPTRPATGRLPVVIWIHGGTWMTGGKDQAAGDQLVADLRAGGFMVVAMNYTLYPTAPFPAQIQDLTCGVRSLRARADRYDIDRTRIGAMGVSAGGHLAAMLGVSDRSAEFVHHGHTGWSGAVQAVASLYGVHDLTLRDLADYDEVHLRDIFGPLRLWAAASPITYVRPGLPPFLLVHGDRDSDVPILQSKVMFRALRNAGDQVGFIVVHNAEHGLVPAGGTMSPTRAQVAGRVVSFFQHQLHVAP